MSPNPAATLAVAILPTCVATTTVAMRFYVRAKRGLAVAKDDWTTLLSLILTWFLAVIVIAGVAIGVLGGHTPIDPVSGKGGGIGDKRKVTKISWVSLMVMPLTYGMIKLSVLFLYQRLFVGKVFRWYAIALDCVLVAWSISFAFAFAFQCGTHPHWWWTSLDTIAKCTDSAKSNLAFSVSDVATDFLVLLTPVPIIWGLQRNMSDKLGLTLLFGMGFLSTAAAIVRMAYIIVYDYTSTVGARDLLAINTTDIVWGHVEATVGVIAACLPTLKPLVHGKSPETWLRSLRSRLSLSSSTAPTKRNSYERDVELLAGPGEITETKSFKVEKTSQPYAASRSSSVEKTH